jgi:glycosyltransferase involved in cell wall biosynthesis
MKRRLKVAHIITRLELGGAQQNTLYCCTHHDRRKFEVLLLTGPGGLLDEDARRVKNFKTYFLPELKHPIRPWWDWQAARKIAEILKDEKVDVVHTHSSKAGILGRWAARRAGVPRIIHTVHGWGFYPGQFFLTRWIYQALERWVAGLTDVLIAVSADNQREGLEARIGRKEQYQVIHSGIDPKSYALSQAQSRWAKRELNPENRPCVLILSNFKKQKSPMDVVNIAAQLTKKMPGVLFLWAGDGLFRAKVEAKIAQWSLESNFKLLGWRQDVDRLLAASDVMLLASRHEGLPRVVLQAMAAKKPVVATAVNGTPEAVKNAVTGFLAPAQDIGFMVESLLKILSNPALGRKMGQAGQRALIGTFRIQTMLQEVEKTYLSRDR